MCDYSTKLIAWLDRELEPEEMAAVQQHLPNCEECRANVAKYEQISQAFDAYCRSAISAISESQINRWVPILSAAAAVLVLAATLAVFWRSRVKPSNSVPAFVAPAITAIRSASSPEATAVPSVTSVAKNAAGAHRMKSPTASKSANWVPLQPALEVAIPADSMFPPGAVPLGINFIADVNFAPDGSARQMRLQPRLTAVERSVSQP
jgi:anti-sigma factor RsiW